MILLGLLFVLFVGVVALLFWRHTLHDEFKDKEFKLNNAMERVKYDLSISNNKLKMKEDLIHSSIKAFNALATSSQREVDELRVLNQKVSVAFGQTQTDPVLKEPVVSFETQTDPIIDVQKNCNHLTMIDNLKARLIKKKELLREAMNSNKDMIY